MNTPTTPLKKFRITYIRKAYTKIDVDARSSASARHLADEAMVGNEKDFDWKTNESAFLNIDTLDTSGIPVRIIQGEVTP